MPRFVAAAGLVILMLIAPHQAAAQTTITARGATLRIGGRLHAQYQGSSVEDAIGDFFIRRARINIDATFNDFVDGKVLIDFAKGRATLFDAYVRLNFSDAFRLSMGQMKRAFDLFELSSSTDLSLFERTGKITGVSGCTGVGSVCSYSQLTEALGFAGRDAGMKIDGSSGAVSYQGTITNGTGEGVRDENDGKSFSGRVSVAASGNLVVSGQLALHDYVDPFAETAHAFAWGGDLQMGTWRDGLLVQAAITGGDNWKSLDASDDPGHFLAIQAVASYYHPLDGDRFVGVEPLARISIADPNGSIDDDGGTLITPGVMFYFLGKNKIGANLDFYIPRTGGSEFSFRFGTFLYF